MQNCFDIHGLTRRAQHYQHFGANEAWQEGETMRQEIAKIIRIGRTHLQDPVELATHRVRFFNLVDFADHAIDRRECLRRLCYANHEEGGQGHAKHMRINLGVNPFDDTRSPQLGDSLRQVNLAEAGMFGQPGRRSAAILSEQLKELPVVSIELQRGRASRELTFGQSSYLSVVTPAPHL